MFCCMGDVLLIIEFGCVLVIGGVGFVGVNLVIILLDCGYWVCFFDCVLLLLFVYL